MLAATFLVAAGSLLTAPMCTPKLNYMVKYQDAALDRTFAALADPTRRALIARLGTKPGVSVSELAQPLPMSLPAVMKHLDVLADAGLIARQKVGRTVTCRLHAAPMEQAMDWLARYQRFWSEQLDRLAAFVEEEPCPPSRMSSASPASRSSGTSRPRRARSTRPGPTRKS
jgi:DNA-binding transcriptional ArsR family regulator